jgi:hypothetical protein
MQTVGLSLQKKQEIPPVISTIDVLFSHLIALLKLMQRT